MLTDGSSFYVGAEFLLDSSLEVGVEVDELLLEALTEETLRIAVRNKALEHLSRREHSRFELCNKLIKKEFPRDTVEQVLDECEKRDYLDDERFARLWTENRINRKADGPRLLEAKLAEKGVSRAIAGKIVKELLNQDTIDELIERAAEKGRRKVGSDEMKLKEYLLSRGFEIKEINRFFSKDVR